MATIKSFEYFLDRMQGLLDNAKKHGHIIVPIEDLENTFPKLAESEDERIRKNIIATIHLYYGEPLDDEAKEMIAWLEKQGKNPNNVYDKELSEILGRVIRRYINDPNIPYSEREKVSMEIIPYVERLEKQGEQKLTIEMKTPEESLGIDSDTYNKIVDECVYGEQKPADKIEPKIAAWTPMDEQRVENLLAIIEGHGYPEEVKWLNSLKDRVQPKQQQEDEWTNEDKIIRRNIIDYISSSDIDKMAKDSWLSWLRSLLFKKPYKGCVNFINGRCEAGDVPQKQWKPSYEQMAALNNINLTGSISYITQGQELITLYNDLKKLK